MPGRGPPGVSVLLVELGAGPAAWIGQLLLTYGLAGHWCYPDGAALTHIPSGSMAHTALLLAANLLCLVTAAAAAILSWNNLRRFRAHAGEIKSNASRFLATAGVMASLTFVVAIAFDTFPLLAAPACWHIP